MRIIEARDVCDKSIIEKGKEILGKKLCEVLDTHVITDGDKTYVAGHEYTGTIGIVRETEYGLKPMYFFQNYSRVDTGERFQDDDYDYFINNEGKKVVSLTDLNNRNEYTLNAMENPIDLSPIGITFAQYDSGKDRTLEYQFYVNGLDTLEAALDYAKDYFPGFIRVKTVEMFLNQLKKRQQLYTYNEKSGKYYSPIILGKFIVGTNPIGQEPEKLISELCENGFYTNIPDELVNLMLGKHKVYNELKEIEIAYKRHI